MVYFKKKRKGQTGFVALMIGVTIFLLALALIIPFNETVTGDDVMGANGFDCDNESISNQDKANCMQTDSMQFLWFFVLIGLAGTAIWRTVL